MRRVNRTLVSRAIVAWLLVLLALDASAATLTLSPTSLAFGNQVVPTTSAPKTVTVRNTGTTPLTFGVTFTGAGAGDYAATPAASCTNLAVGATCTVAVRFTPSVLGARPATLTVTDAANSSNVLSIPLTGTGVVATTISPVTLPFAAVVQNTASVTRTVRLTNNQDIPLAGVTFTSSNPDYAIFGCGSTIVARGSCTASIVFTPTAAPGTASNGTLTIAHDAATSPQTVAMTGSSVFPMTLSVTTQTLANTAHGDTSAFGSIVLKNNLRVPITNLSLVTAAPFSATGCPTPLAAGASCTISTAFSPTVQLGRQTGTLAVESTDPSAWNRPAATLAATALAAVSVTPNPLAYGNVTVAVTSAAKLVTIKNNRKTIVTLGSPALSISGPAAAEFTATTTTCGTTLAAGASCTAGYTFRPSEGGSRAAVLNVSSDALNSPHTTALTGTGATPITISPSSVAFSNVGVGLTSVGKLVTLKNNQSIPVVFSSINPTSPEFVKQDTATTTTTCGTTLAAGATCTVSLVMKPTVAGTRSAALQIVSNSSASPNIVPLTGLGINGVTTSVSALAFGSQKINTTSISKQFTLTNHQTVNATIGAVVSGPFAATDACGGVILAKSTCVVSVTFTPLTAVALTGAVNFTLPGTTALGKVSLSGTGTTTNPAAAVRNVSPGAGSTNSTVATSVPNVVVTGNGYTSFAGNSVVSFGAGVTVSNLRNVSANSLTVDLVIAPNATPGARTVTVTTLVGTVNQVASLTAGFVVSASSALSFSSITPDVAALGQTLNVSIVGSNTHFQAGVTTANFGEGVFVNGAVQVIDALHAIANVSVSPTATLGWRAVTIVTGGEYATLTPVNANGPGFLVVASNAAIASISPATEVQGAAPFVVTISGVNTHFVQNASQLSLGLGINIGNVTVVNQLQLTASIAVTGTATPGVRDVTVVTGGEVARRVGAFTVTPSATIPYLAGVTPSSGQQGQTVSLTLTGVNTHFTTDSPAPALTLGSNINVSSLTVVNDTTITAVASIALIADVGGRNAILSSGGTDYNFTFVVVPSTAAITSVSPATGPQGSSVSITVTGVNTHWQQGTTNAWFLYQGCLLPTVDRVTINSATSAVLDVTIPDNACVGQLPFQLATGGEVVGASFGVYRQTPSLTLSPSTGMIGTTQTVNFVGEFTHFANAVSAGPTTAVIDGALVDIQNFTVLSPTSATATFVIDPAAIPGPCSPARTAGCHKVTLTTPIGTGFEILTADFIVTSTPAVLTTIEPFHAAPGTTLTVRIRGSYTHFASGQTTVGFGPDISTVNPVVVSPTELTVNISIGSAAATGWRSAYVNTGAEQLTIGFRVDGPASPLIVGVSPSSGAQGQTLDVTIKGENTNFVSGSQLILGAGVTVSNFVVIDPTTATATIAVSATAPVGPNAVVVLSPTAGDQEVASGAGFNVVRGPSQLLSATNPSAPTAPLTATQSQTLLVSLVGQGTHWLQGGTSADFGGGVYVNQLTVQDATHATAQITVLSNAALGFHTVSMFTDGEYVTLVQGLNVVQGTPTLLSSSPTAGQQNTTFDVQILGRYTHWAQGVTTASFGNGITVNSFTVIDSVSGVANVSIDPLAYIDIAPGCHSLTVTTGTEQVFLPYQLCVQRGAAGVTNVSPNSALQGNTLNVNITGHNTHFTQGLTTADFGTGITAGNVTVTNATSATVTLGVATTATNGLHTATLRTAGEIASLTYAFNVGPSVATLNGAAPVSGQQGQSVTVRLIGQYTHWTQGLTTVTFGQGITVGALTVVNPTTVDVPISIANVASPGGRNVTVATGGEIVSANVFTVTSGGAIISDVTPQSGNQGQDIELTITGQNTNWAQGLTQFSMSGAGGDITINYVVINNATSATAGITISPTAYLGARSIYMTTGPEALVNANAFIVTGGVPAVGSVSPGSARAGDLAVNVQITGLYTQWTAGTTTVDFGPGITVQTFTVNNSTSITAVVDVATAAGLGSRTVTVRTGTQALFGHFQVTNSTPPTPYISYLSPWSGLGGQTFTINVSGQYTHWDPATTTIGFGDPATSGITVNSFQVTGLTTARANITIAPGAAVGPRTLEIATGTELVTATFSVVQEVPALSIVDPTSGMQGATMTVNVIGQHTGFNATTTFDFGGGIVVDSVTILGPTIAQVTISIDQLAPQGFRYVVATTGSEVASGPGAGFSVTPSQAVIVSVTPNTAKQQDTIDIQVVGQGTHWDSSTTFSFGGGISVTAKTVADATHATLTLSIAPLATLGAYGISATTGGEVASMPSAFVVQEGTPLILSSSPGSGQQQANVTFTILGQVTNWQQGVTTVEVGNGLVIDAVNVTSATGITASGHIEWWAPLGSRTVTVTTGTQVLTLPGAFYVTGGPAAIAQLSPNQSGQGTTLPVAITGTNTHFTQGQTYAYFGPGITVNGAVSVTDFTHATASITIAANATPGFNSVTVQTQAETATAQGAFTIQSTTPTIQFASPAAGAQSAALNVTVIGSLTNFNSTTTFDFGPGITVNYPATITSGTQATVNITISALAPRTTRDVTATTGGVTAIGPNKFTVAAGPAYISAINPNTAQQNQNGLQLAISGNGTHFTAAAPVVNVGAGVSVTSQTVVSDTLLNVVVNVSPSAPLQVNDVTVATLGELATLQGGFTVQPGQPTVVSVSPLSAHQNETVSVVVTGLYTHFNSTTVPSFGAGITVNGFAANSATQATVSITVDPAAVPGSRTVTMTTGTEIASGPGAFTVLQGVPQLSSVSPNTGAQNSTQTVTISGLYTNFQQGTTMVAFSGGGVTAGTAQVNGPTQLQVSVTVAAGATASLRTVTVTTGSEVVSLGNAFQVLPGQPLISVISPNVGVPNSTVNVSITGDFTNFVQGTTRANFGAGISVNGAAAGTFGLLTVNGSTSATATLQIVSGASLGARDVTVETGSEVLNVNSGFTVQSASPTPPIITRTSPANNAIGAPINTAFTIEFSAPVDRTTVTAANVRLTDVTTQYYCWNDYSKTIPASIQVDASARVVTFTPSAVLAVGRVYSACINYGQQGTAASIKDPSGNHLQGDYRYFTTGFAPDNSGPALLAANIDGNSPVATNTPVVLGFTKPINPITTAAGVTVTAGGTPVPGTFGYTPDYTQITFTPSSGFAPTTSYVVSYTGALEDSVGNPLSNPGSIVFTTAAGADNAAPVLLSRTPTPGSITGTTPTLQAVFDEALNPLRLTSGNVYLYNILTGGVVQGTTMTLSSDRKTLTLGLARPLEPSTGYYWYLTVYDAGAHAYGTALNFSTSAQADTTAPAILSVTPPDGSTDVPVNPLLQVRLSEALDPTFGPHLAISPSIGLTYSTADNVHLTFTRATALAPATTYTLTLSGVRDQSGNATTPFTWTFTTRASSTADTTAGTMSMVPANGSTNVSSTSSVVFSLSKAVDVNSVSSNSLRLYDNNAAQWLPGSIAVSTDLKTLTVTPSVPFVGGHVICAYTSYYASLLDLAGNVFGYLYNHCFTIGAGADTTPPQVISVTPFANATGIGPYNPVTVTFSEPMSVATLNSSNVAVFNGTTLVTSGASIAADGTSLTFNIGLAYGTTYTIVVSTNVTDLSGNTLPAMFSSTFTTAPQPVTSRPSVHAGGFRPGAGATGVSPATRLTFFLTQPVVPATVPGALFVSQDGVLITGTTTLTHDNRVVTFTPSAPLAAGALIEVWLTSAATDAAGNQLMDYQSSFRVAPDFSAVGPTIVGYTPGYGQTVPSNRTIDIVLSEPANPASVTSSSFYLKDTSNNPVAATISLHNGNRMLRLKPTAPLAGGIHYYYITTGVTDVSGTPLASFLPEFVGGGVSRSYFYPQAPADLTSPAVIHAAPANGATGIGANALIELTFSEVVQTATVDPTTVTLSAGGSPIPYTFSTTNYADGTMRLRIAPGAALPASTAVTVGVTPGVIDFSGNPTGAFSATFTTGSGVNFTQPRVIVSSVGESATNVPVTSVITLTFDRPMNTRSFVQGNTIYLYDTFSGVYPSNTLSFSPDLTQVTLAPNAPLAVNRTYSLWTCSTQDLNGNFALCQSFSFTTALFAATGGPVVVLTVPAHTLTNVPVNSKPEVLFDRSISRGSLSGVTLTANGNPVTFTPLFSTGDSLLTLVPGSVLQPNTDYVLTLAGIKDASGTTMTSPVTVQFRTGPTFDVTPPSIVERTPPSGSVTGTNPVIRMRFSERTDRIRASAGSIYNQHTGQNVNGVVIGWNPDATIATFSYPGPLESNTAYYACSPNVYDLGGNTLGGSCLTFYTGSAADVSALTVSGVTPPAGSTGVPLNPSISVRLSERPDPMSVSSSSLSVTPAAPGTLVLSSDGLSLSYNLTSNLSPSTAYTINVNGFTDLSGNPVTPFSSGFTTGSATQTGNGSISLTTPAPGAMGVPVGDAITVTLNRPVNPLSVTPDGFQVWRNNAVRLAGTISIGAAGTTLTFTPDTALPANSPINVYVGYWVVVSDLSGQPFSYLSATFNTGGGADTTPPQVLSVNPANNASSVGPLATVTLVFSESLDPGTITAANFALFDGFTNLNAGVTRSGDNRTVTMSVTLPYGRTITVVADTGVTDINGNALAAAFRSSFVTLPSSQSPTPTITQMRPAPGATNVPLDSLITLYASDPIAASSLANAVVVAQNGVLVNGTATLAAAGHAIVFTPAQPFVAGAVIQVFVTTGLADTSGARFTAYSQAFTARQDYSTGPLQVVDYFPTYGSSQPTNTIIDLHFNKPIDPAYVTSTYFYLWDWSGSPSTPVAASVALVQPTIVRITPLAALPPGTYFWYRAASGLKAADGTLFGSNYDIYFLTSSGPDMTTPAVTVSPGNGATGVGDNATIRLRFNKLMDTPSINGSTVTLASGSVNLPISLSFSTTGNVTNVVVTPQAPLPDNANVSLSLSAGIVDRAGQALTAQVTTFQTGTGPDTARPFIVSRSPDQNQSTNVPTNSTTFTWVYNEPLDPITVVTGLSHYLYPSTTGVPLAATVTLGGDGKTVVVTLGANLAPNATYTACANSTALDLSGNAVNASCLGFTTSASAAATGPQVVATGPIAGASAVGTNARMEIVFDNAVASPSFGGITITSAAGTVPYLWRWMSSYPSLNGRAVELVPYALLDPNTTYTVSVSGVKDLSGVAMMAAHNFSFTTGPDPLLSTTSFLTSAVTSNGVATQLVNSGNITNVSPATGITLSFSGPVSPASLLNGGARVRLVSTNALVPVFVTLTTDGMTAVLTPEVPLAANTQYRLNVNYEVAVLNQAGYQVSGSGGSFNFTTGTPTALFERSGLADPVASGFTPLNGPTGGPVANDAGTGFDAWNVIGSSGGAGYIAPLSAAQKQAAYARGWRLTGKLRALSSAGWVNVAFGPGLKRFDMNVFLNSSGDTVVKLSNTVLPHVGPEYTLVGSGSSYHTFELVFDPLTQTARLLVDGVTRITGYAGTTEFNGDYGLWFGSTGQANHHLARFEIMP